MDDIGNEELELLEIFDRFRVNDPFEDSIFYRMGVDPILVEQPIV